MYVANRDKQMSNPIGRRYSLCPENKFIIQTRSYHVIGISILYLYMIHTSHVFPFTRVS